MTARTLGLVALCLMFAAPLRAATPVGLFEDHADLGGPAVYSAAMTKRVAIALLAAMLALTWI